MSSNGEANNSNNKDNIRKRIRRISGNTESDAVHPRFNTNTDIETEEYQKEHHYFCTICRAYFAPTTLALHEHFRPGRIIHEPIASCVYCQGPVYNYSINEQRRFYHDCKETES